MGKIERIMLEDGEPYPPRIRGTIEKFLENKEEFAGKCDAGISIPDSYDDDLEWVHRQWCNYLNLQLGEDCWDFVYNGEHSDEFKEIFIDYVESNDDVMERVEDLVELGPLLDDNGGGGDEEGDGDGGQNESMSQSSYPELHDIGIVDDHGNVVNSKFKGLFIAYVDETDEILGEGDEPNEHDVCMSFLQWGLDEFGKEWARLMGVCARTGLMDRTVNWVLVNKDDVREEVADKFSGGEDIGLGEPDTDDLIESFLDSEVPGWDEDEQDDEQTTTPADERWNEYEREAGTKSDDGGKDSGDSVQGSGQGDSAGSGCDDGSSDGDSDSTSDTPSDVDGLDQWAEEHGGLDREESRIERLKRKVERGDSPSGGSTAERPYPIEWPVVDRIDELEKDKIYEGNTFEWSMKLPENSVDTIVTSPPYYALRDYEVEDRVPISGDWTCDHELEDNFCTKCGAFNGQLGREPNPALFIDHVVDLMERYKTVLKPTGSLWLNIGDTYAGQDIDGRANATDKSRIMVPERVYRRMVESGWVLRDYVIWAKKVWMPGDEPRGNGKPLSTSSRLADQWEPMVRFTPEPDSYVDVDSNRLMPPSFEGDMGKAADDSKFRDGEDTRRGRTYNPMGTNPPDVWLVNGDGYQGDHRAVFPEELARRCVKLSTPDRVCETCGKPYEKEVQVEDENTVTPGGDHAIYKPRCECGTDYEPGVAFDPFLGSGTTGLAASEEGFHWAGVELSEKYADIARDRIPDTRSTGLDQWI